MPADSDDEVQFVNEVAGPGPSSQQQAAGHRAKQQQPSRQRQRASPRQGGGTIDLTAEQDSDEDDEGGGGGEVQITGVRPGAANKRPLALAEVIAHQQARKLLKAAGAPPRPGAPPPPPQPPQEQGPPAFQCCVCMDAIKNMATTPCGHLFCYECVLGWVAKASTCPQCRAKVTKTRIIRVYPPGAQ